MSKQDMFVIGFKTCEHILEYCNYLLQGVAALPLYFDRPRFQTISRVYSYIMGNDHGWMVTNNGIQT